MDRLWTCIFTFFMGHFELEWVRESQKAIQTRFPTKAPTCMMNIYVEIYYI